MKTLLLLTACLFTVLPALANDDSKPKPVQHLKVPEVTSSEEAKKIFVDKTSELKSHAEAAQLPLPQIHILTYTLEKSVAHFVDNLDGERQGLAQEIAVVVEDLHLSSEGSQQTETKNSLGVYLDLAEKFIAGF